LQYDAAALVGCIGLGRVRADIDRALTAAFCGARRVVMVVVNWWRRRSGGVALRKSRRARQDCTKSSQMGQAHLSPHYGLGRFVQL
jgi:hypothetical protein